MYGFLGSFDDVAFSRSCSAPLVPVVFDRCDTRSALLFLVEVTFPPDDGTTITLLTFEGAAAGVMRNDSSSVSGVRRRISSLEWPDASDDSSASVGRAADVVGSCGRTGVTQRELLPVADTSCARGLSRDDGVRVEAVGGGC